MMKNKKLFYGILVIALLAIVGTGLLVLNRPSTTPTSTQEVTIATDKIEYVQGETVKITVRNGLGKSVWRDGQCGGFSFWDLQKLENGQWKRLVFSLPYLEKEKEVCDFILCERAEPVEFKSGAELSYDWRLSICEWPEKPIGVPKTEPKRIEEGTYRISFTYGLNMEGFNLLEKKTIYSNEFTVKEKKEIACFQLNEQQCRNQPTCVPLGGAITTYFPEGEDETFSFKECVNRVPEYKNCKEVVKMTQMRGGSQYSKECRCCCGEGPFCKERSYPEK